VQRGTREVHRSGGHRNLVVQGRTSFRYQGRFTCLDTSQQRAFAAKWRTWLYPRRLTESKKREEYQRQLGYGKDHRFVVHFVLQRHAEHLHDCRARPFRAADNRCTALTSRLRHASECRASRFQKPNPGDESIRLFVADVGRPLDADYSTTGKAVCPDHHSMLRPRRLPFTCDERKLPALARLQPHSQTELVAKETSAT
jgi:hypothetical protein